MRFAAPWLVAALLVLACGCNRKPETLVESGYDQKEMDAAIARARSEVDTFIQDLTKGNGSKFAVKAPITDQGKTEHFWITDITYRDGAFQGVIGNEPGIVGNVRMGQKWTIKKEEISDWLFLRDDKMHGNYTIRPLFKTMAPEEVEQFRAMLAKP